MSLKPAQDWLKSDPALDGVIIAKQLDDASRFGSLDIGPDGLLKGFREKQPGAGWINAGIYLLKAKLLAMEPKAMSIEFDCFPRWLADGARIGVLAAKADFLDIGTPETLAKATSSLRPIAPLWVIPPSWPPSSTVSNLTAAPARKGGEQEQGVCNAGLPCLPRIQPGTVPGPDGPAPLQQPAAARSVGPQGALLSPARLVLP